MADREKVEEWKQNPWSKLPTWGKWALGALAVFVVIGIAVGDESEEPDQSTATPAKVERPKPKPQPKPAVAAAPAPKPEPVKQEPSPQQLAREALGDSVSSDLAVGEAEVRSAQRTGQSMKVILSTPEGGFDGPSTDDADALASAAFAKLYADAEWRGGTLVVFRGGLVSSATGRDLPNADTFAYGVERYEAPRIDWTDGDALYVIDWSLYRTFCHPAFKGC